MYYCILMKCERPNLQDSQTKLLSLAISHQPSVKSTVIMKYDNLYVVIPRSFLSIFNLTRNIVLNVLEF